jgi:Cu(I)/Ag(I) efflux system membrane fusion protein
VTEAYPGETFHGRIAFIDPVLNRDTRTVKVRVNVPNKDGRLKPEMFVRAVVRSKVASGGKVLDADLAGKWISPMHPEIVKDEPGTCDICGMPLVRAESLGYSFAEPTEEMKPLVVPVSALLVTGTRAIVYVEIPTAKEPTFEGREIVLGPRAGDYYLVRHGLQPGELVVTNGNFKLDSALQISAKPSMMTPAGGGGGGHGGAKSDEGGAAGHQMVLTAQSRAQFERVVAAFDAVTAAVNESNLPAIHASFASLQKALSEVDEKLLAGHAEMLWHELSMLLGNDAVEGREARTLQDADRVYQSLKGNVRRFRGQFGLAAQEDVPELARLVVPKAFQKQLVTLLEVYEKLHDALASDDAPRATSDAATLQPVVAAINSGSLQGDTLAAWEKERANLLKVAEDLAAAVDIKSMRAAFALLSDEMIALVRMFDLGSTRTLYELHCPMAFEGRGASWLQSNDQTRNPYYGPSMLTCADRVARIPPEELEAESEHGQPPHHHEH